MGKNRRHSKIGKLPKKLREEVENMLVDGATYREIVEFLRERGVGISQSAVCNYARQLSEAEQMIRIASQNFERLLLEMEKYPDLDVADVILRLAGQNLLPALMQADEKTWADVSPDKVLQQANGLVRAAATKRRADAQTTGARQAALEETKALVWDVLRKERPDLYAEMAKYINAKQDGDA